MKRSRLARSVAGVATLLSSGGFAGYELAAAPAASATPIPITSTWTGGSTAPPSWSDAGNWSSTSPDQAPSNGSIITTLSFPDLSSCDSELAASGSTVENCYWSSNDLTGVSVGTLDIATSPQTSYQISGNGLVLSGGMTVTGANATHYPAVVANNLTLTGTGSTWSLPGSSLELDGNVTGAGTAVTTALSNSASLNLGDGSTANSVQASSFAVTGGDSTQTGQNAGSNGYVQLSGTDLNGTNGNPLNLTDAALSGDGSVGALSVTGGSVNLDNMSAPTTLSTASANFDSNSQLSFDFDGSVASPSAGTDYSQLTSTGAIDLGGAQLVLNSIASNCTDPAPGTSYTLVTAGSLTGKFSDSQGATYGNGDVMSLPSCDGTSQVDYGVSETSTTLTLKVLQPTTTTISAASASPQVNQADLLTATVTSASGTPSGTVEFRENYGNDVIPGCSSQPLTNGQATCDATFGSAGQNGIGATFVPDGSNDLAPSTGGTTVDVGAASATPAGPGYDLFASDGGVFNLGGLPFNGSMASKPLNKPIVGGAMATDGKSYYLVASDGGVFNFGSGATFDGSMGNKPLNQPIVGMAVDPATGGYWVVASDGGVFNFDAPFYGSMGNKALNQPIVGIAAAPDGQGYYLVAKDGGIFNFGPSAHFQGSEGSKHLNAPVVGMAVDSYTGGYWVVASDGGIFNFNAPYQGSMGNKPLNKPVVGMAVDAATEGYWVVASDGGIFNFNAPYQGSMGNRPLNKPVVGMAVG